MRRGLPVIPEALRRRTRFGSFEGESDAAGLALTSFRTPLLDPGPAREGRLARPGQ